MTGMGLIIYSFLQTSKLFSFVYMEMQLLLLQNFDIFSNEYIKRPLKTITQILFSTKQSNILF